MQPAVIHLVGYPASGKLTVATALVEAAAARGQTFVRLDNHLTGDVILSVVDRSLNPIPRAVWDRVEDVREVMYQAIVELSPPDWSFVLTNVVQANDPMDARAVERVHQLAMERLVGRGRVGVQEPDHGVHRARADPVERLPPRREADQDAKPH